MGDGGKLYGSVPQEMVGLYKEKVLPWADVLFPNQTEAEYAQPALRSVLIVPTIAFALGYLQVLR